MYGEVFDQELQQLCVLQTFDPNSDWFNLTKYITSSKQYVKTVSKQYAMSSSKQYATTSSKQKVLKNNLCSIYLNFMSGFCNGCYFNWHNAA